MPISRGIKFRKDEEGPLPDIEGNEEKPEEEKEAEGPREEKKEEKPEEKVKKISQPGQLNQKRHSLLPVEE